MHPDLLKLISDNEQDEANALTWWRESSEADKMHVLRAITREYDDPVMEIMSRFAQLSFARMLAAEHQKGV